jgi:hypothetical protein
MATTLIKGHLNQLLTNYAVGTAKNLDQALIGEIVAPTVLVNELSNAYAIFGEDDLRLENSKYSELAQIQRVNWTESGDSYVAIEYALESAISWARMNNGDTALRLERRHTVGLARKLKLQREKAIADTLFSTATFSGKTAALAAPDRWDADTSSPVKKVSDAKETVRLASGVDPNTVIVGGGVWASLRNHPDITSRVAGLVAGTPATEAQAAAAFGVDRVIVGRAIYNSALEGVAASHAAIWGKFALVCYIDPIAGDDMEGIITPASTFVCDVAGSPFSTYTYESQESRSHVIQCYDCYAVKAIATVAGYLYSTVIT